MDLQSILGYQQGSPFFNNPYNDINSGIIDMSNTPIDLIGIDNKGNKKIMKAGTTNPYKFEGNKVREYPRYQKGGDVYDFLFGGDDDEEDSKPEVKQPTAPAVPDLVNNDEYENTLAMAMQVNSDSFLNQRQIQSSPHGSEFDKAPTGFRSFSSYEEGRRALEHQLELYQTGKTRNPVSPNSTLLQAMSVYAPSSDNNNPYKYAQFIGKRLGVDINTPISQLDRGKWADAITIMEGNKKGNNPGNLR